MSEYVDIEALDAMRWCAFQTVGGPLAGGASSSPNNEYRIHNNVLVDFVKIDDPATGAIEKGATIYAVLGKEPVRLQVYGGATEGAAGDCVLQPGSVFIMKGGKESTVFKLYPTKADAPSYLLRHASEVPVDDAPLHFANSIVDSGRLPVLPWNKKKEKYWRRNDNRLYGYAKCAIPQISLGVDGVNEDFVMVDPRVEKHHHNKGKENFVALDGGDAWLHTKMPEPDTGMAAYIEPGDAFRVNPLESHEYEHSRGGKCFLFRVATKTQGDYFSEEITTAEIAKGTFVPREIE